MQKIMKNKGITLVALVVTIVIMLILAGVTLNLTLGDNGLLIQVQKAKEKTDEATKNEISSMGELEDILHETQTGIVVEKVQDVNPGKLEQDETEENIYTINSIEDLIVFAHNVTSGTENYEGKTVKLGLSLDFASNKSYVDVNRTDYGEYGYNGELKKLLNESGFIPIGTQERLADEDKSSKSFHGTFDGDGNIIYNLKIREENITVSNECIGTGMFILNYGTIQNLGIEEANIYVDIKDYSYWRFVGILAAGNLETGKINRCHISGKISGIAGRCDIGGIVGATSSGEVCDSYSKVDMEIIGSSSPGRHPYVGLIAGSCGGGTIKNVYSKGTVHAQVQAIVGGIVAGCSPPGEVRNAYTVSKIEAKYDGVSGWWVLGGAWGTCTGDGVSNCYYLENNIEIIGEGKPMAGGGEEKTEEYMKGEGFVAELNNGQEDSPWKPDTNNINDGYPILSWQQ